MKRLLTVLATGLLLGLSGALLPATSAQEVVVPAFPAAAIIRGENIRLRVDPADGSADVAIMQRGDAVTITGEPVSADGFTFYPIELVATGETGWVRDLFINPTSIALVEAPVAPADNGNGRERPNRNRDNAAEETPAPEPAELTKEERQARREERNQQAAETPPETVAPVANDATPTPESANVVAPVTAAASVAGVGAAVSDPITLEPGRYRATASMQVTESSGFIATLKGPNDFSEELFNETIDTPRAWTTGTVVRIRDAGEYTVEVSDTAEAWSIAFEPLPARE